MNRRPTGSLSLAKAITGFLQYKAAEGLSPNTLQSYQRDLKLWLEYAGDIPLQKITTALLQEYFVGLRTDYRPRRITRNREALASGSWGHGSDQLFIWDTQSWKRIRALDDPNELVFSVAWSADGKRLVSAGSDGTLRWWNPQNGQCILSRQGHAGPVQSLRASPDGRLLASCGDDGAIQIWQMESGERVETLRRDRPYERLNITGIKGLTDAQKQTLKMMGAVESDN